MNANVLFPRFLLLLISGLSIQLCAFSVPEDLDIVYGRRLLSASDEVACSAPCPSSWIMNGNKTKCFKYMGLFKSWDESEASCKQYDGHLASLTTFQDLNTAHQLCNKSVGGCWVGGRSQNTTAGPIWNWSDNSSYYNDSIFPTLDFRSNHVAHVSNFCTLFKYGLQTMVAERCSKPHRYVCTLNIGNKCYHSRYREYLIILAVVCGVIICTTSIVVVWLLVFKRSKRRRRSKKLSNSASSALVPPSWRVFTSEELRSITKCFSEGNRLPGHVKTGSTYRGTLPGGSKVAIKRLKSSGYQRKKEFYSEVGRIARLHHPSLVAVKGCCYDHGDRYIVYEYIVNGSLDRWLHHVPRGGRCLNWSMRMKIATTLAQGIAFFHDKVKPQVVHRDIRASNVLLDEDFGAHLMGVGLSKFVPWEAMQEKTVMAGGSHGYLAPEFVYRNELTTKSDVYSFGVLLLEIVTGRRPAQRALDSSVGWQSIFEWATPLVQANRYMELLDPQMSTASSSSSENSPEVGVVQKVVDLVYACTQNVPSMRPRMSHVVHQLQQLAPSSPAVV